MTKLNKKATTTYGTAAYMAPETIKCEYEEGTYDNSKIDVYSLGLTLIRIHTGYQPMQAFDKRDFETMFLLQNNLKEAFWKKSLKYNWLHAKLSLQKFCLANDTIQP